LFFFCVEEQKGLVYHLEGLRVPLAVRVPQFGNHCSSAWTTWADYNDRPRCISRHRHKFSL